MKNIFVYLLGFILISSCQKKEDELNNEDYLIFGHFYGECIGEKCVETYKLTNSNLYEDSESNYAHNSFSFVQLSNAQFIEVKDLMDYIPSNLWNETETNFGCPDCYDQGGIFVEYKRNGVVKNWRIDKDFNSIPSYLQSFVNEIETDIEFLSN